MGLDVSGYVSGILQAQTISAVMPQVVTNFIANPLLAVIGIAKDTGRALKEMFTGSMDLADNLGEMAANAGVAVEALSGLGLVAKKNGADTQTVADAFKFLGKNQAEALAGSKEAKAAFANLGVAFANADGSARPLEGLLLDVGDALNRLPSAGQRTAAAMDLLGRGGTQMLATFAQGSGAIREQIAMYERMGAVVTQSTAEQSGRWNDLMDDLAAAWQGFKLMLAEPIRTALMPMLENLVAWVASNPEKIQAVIAGMATVIKDVLGAVGSAVKFVVDNFQTMATVLGGVVAAVIGGKIVAAIFSMVSALRTASVAQAILLSLSGPKGWAILAGAAVTAGAAVAGISSAFDDASKKAEEFKAKGTAAAQATAKTAAGATGPGGEAGGTTVNVQVAANVDPRTLASQTAEAVRKKLEANQDLLRASVFAELVGRGL
jgi:hypothetical protein